MKAFKIPPVSKEALEKAWRRLDRLTKPPRSLGRLEELAARLAAIQGTDRPALGPGAVVVAAADHGVAAEGVSAYPPEVTYQMVRNFLSGGAAINQIAKSAGAEAGVPVVTDGFPVTAGALLATRLAPELGDYLFAGHRSVEPGHARQLEALGLTPALDLALRLGEGTGAVLAFPVLRAAAEVLSGMATFEEAGVSGASSPDDGSAPRP